MAGHPASSTRSSPLLGVAEAGLAVLASVGVGAGMLYAARSSTPAAGRPQAPRPGKLGRTALPAESRAVVAQSPKSEGGEDGTLLPSFLIAWYGWGRWSACAPVQ